MRLASLILLLLAAPFTFANFEHKGEVKVTYPTGQVKAKSMPLAYKQGQYEHTFTVGSQEYQVTGQPQSYSIALLLQANNYVWVQEFAKGYFEGFDWQIGEHSIKLYKRILSKPVKGDYILTIDGKDYFFQQNLAQITFKFDDKGIKSIEVDGMVASLGLNEAKNPCDEFEPDSDEYKECSKN